jgi:hypothetical protein
VLVPALGDVLRGRATFRFDDHEDTLEAGDAFYVPGGHVPVILPSYRSFHLIVICAKVNELPPNCGEPCGTARTDPRPAVFTAGLPGPSAPAVRSGHAAAAGGAGSEEAT